MYSHGAIMLNDDEIGTFFLDQEERIVCQFRLGAAGTRESLEYAAEQGFRFGLQLKPEYTMAENRE